MVMYFFSCFDILQYNERVSNSEISCIEYWISACYNKSLIRSLVLSLSLKVKSLVLALALNLQSLVLALALSLESLVLALALKV